MSIEINIARLLYIKKTTFNLIGCEEVGLYWHYSWLCVNLLSKRRESEKA